MPLPEKTLISEIRRLAKFNAHRGGRTNHAVQMGIGDDCAVLRTVRGRDSLVTTDFMLEGVHFRRDWHSPESIGHRCVARGLSDIAAMGGDPEAVFLSLALPGTLPQSWVTRFVRSLVGLAKRHGAVLAGGDTAESPDGVFADIIVVGTVPRGKAVLRSGARPGDRIFVSGELGGSAAAVLKMRTKGKKKLRPRDYARHFHPEPRVALGRVLREKHLASAMIDTSDGLSTDLTHICEESGVGAELDAALIPRSSVGKPLHKVDLEMALHGGEDYELLFTAPAGKRVPVRMGGVRLTQIGVITRGQTILVRGSELRAYQLLPRGWEHFGR